MALEISDFIPIYQDKKIKGYNMAEYRKTTDNDIINPDNPWAEDRLNRQKVANDFTAILKGIKDLPFVISIDSNYGTGKTFFIKRWVEDLKTDGFVACYHNAWNTDYQKDPLVPFVNSIINQFPVEVRGRMRESFEKLVGILKTVGNFAAKCFTGQDNIIGEGADVAQQAVNWLQGIGQKYIENNNQTTKIIEAFKAKLLEESQKQKIVIFVDELERCRPTYAVELLEIIKHLFNVPNVIFVLATDRQQLKHTIARLYGDKMDGDGYLRRFIDLELHLPTPNRQAYCVYLQSDRDVKNDLLPADHVYGWNYFRKNFVLWSEIYNLSLREMEQIWNEVSYIVNVIPENGPKLMPVLAWLLIVKSKDIDQFYKFKKGDFQALKQRLSVIVPTELINNNMYYEDFLIDLEMCTTAPSVLNALNKAPDSDKYRLADKWERTQFDLRKIDNKPLSMYMCDILSYLSPISK